MVGILQVAKNEILRGVWEDSNCIGGLSAAIRALALSLGAIAAISLLFPTSSTAQAAYTPNVNNVGLPSTGVFSGGSIDSVQLQNGNLHVDIPLLHLPGIGMDTDIHFVNDTQLFNTTQVTYGSASSPQQWTQITMGRNGFAQVSDPLSGVLKFGTHQENWSCYDIQQTIWSGVLYHLDYMNFTDPDGTGHTFPIWGYELGPGAPGSGSNSNGEVGSCIPGELILPNSYSQDATGYNLTLTGAGSVVSLTDKHGTQYTLGAAGGSGTVGAYLIPPPPTSPPALPFEVVGPTIIQYSGLTKVEDSNGNTISSAVSASGVYTLTDTVGRTITETGSCGFNLNLVGEAYANEPQKISYIDQNNAPQTINIYCTPVEINLPLLCPGNSGATCSGQIGTPGTAMATNLPTSIVLQNGDTYTISYSGPNCLGTLGEICSITLPTGGTISYAWGGVTPIGGGVLGRQVLSRTVTANGQSSTWQFQYPNPIASVTARTVTDPNMNDTVYTFGSLNANCPPPSPLVTQEVSYNGSQSANNPIATKTIGYTFYGSYLMDGTFLPTSNILTWNSAGLTTEADTIYDGALPAGTSCSGGPPTVITRGNVSSKVVYDYGSAGSGTHGALLSNTQYSYLFQSNSAYAAANIADRVSQVSVYNSVTPSSVALVAQTTTTYDQFNQSSINGQGRLVSSAGVNTQHDTSYSTAVPPFRGLPTSTTRYTVPNTPSITTYVNYNDLGKETVATDARLNSTTFTYGAQGAFVATTTPPAVNGVSHMAATNYDPNTGLLISQTDANHQTTSYTYDFRMRPLITTRPDGGTTTNDYVSPNQIVTTVTEIPSPNKVTTTDLDGVGRTISVSTAADPVCVSLTVNTAYDLLSRVSAVSNPHCNSSQATDGWTQYAYDAIGRLTTKTNPDGSPQTWSINGNVIDFCDEVWNHWRRTYDAADWLTQVLEPVAPGCRTLPTLETDYYYDTLGDLLRVDQWGGPIRSAGDHLRTFAYDALSRLLKSFNPETGTVSYAYDPNGNVTSKTDARGVTTWYLYDSLNRLYSKTYSNDASSTPTSCYQYDVSSATPICPSSTNWAGPNWVGRLTNQWTQSSSAGSCLAPTGGFLTKRSILCYDPMGRISSEQQYTPASQAAGTSYPLAYTYDWAGNLLTSTSGAGPAATPANPAPITFTNMYDGAGRLQTLTSSWTNNGVFPVTLFSPPTAVPSTPCANAITTQYAPFGGLANAALGNGLTLNRAYDKRLRTTCENDTGSVGNATGGSATVTITGAEQIK